MTETPQMWNDSRIGTAGRQALKSAIGMMMGQAPPNAVSAYYLAKISNETNRYKDEIRFACLCMSCLWESGTPKVLIQDIIHDVYNNPQTDKSRKQLCMELLNEPWRRDGFFLLKLSSLVRTMRKNRADIMPDFERLAYDLERWNSESQYIQRDWIEKILK